jgi:hypothetical protein
VPLGDIAQLVGHSGTTVTELVYRHQIRPVIQTGATVMDRLFGQANWVRSHSVDASMLCQHLGWAAGRRAACSAASPASRVAAQSLRDGRGRP